MSNPRHLWITGLSIVCLTLAACSSKDPGGGDGAGTRDETAAAAAKKTGGQAASGAPATSAATVDPDKPVMASPPASVHPAGAKATPPADAKPEKVVIVGRATDNETWKAEGVGGFKKKHHKQAHERLMRLAPMVLYVEAEKKAYQISAPGSLVAEHLAKNIRISGLRVWDTVVPKQIEIQEGEGWKKLGFDLPE